MWLIDEWGIDQFRTRVEEAYGRPLPTAALEDEIDWDKRDHIGLYPQQQPGLYYAGLHVPVGRLTAEDMFDLAQIAEVYGSGEIRLTVEQNVIIPHIPDSRLELLQQGTSAAAVFPGPQSPGTIAGVLHRGAVLQLRPD